MFELSVRAFNYIYNNCQQLGSVLGFGVFEGFVMYSCLISLIVVKLLDVIKTKR